MNWEVSLQTCHYICLISALSSLFPLRSFLLSLSLFLTHSLFGQDCYINYLQWRVLAITYSHPTLCLLLLTKARFTAIYSHSNKGYLRTRKGQPWQEWPVVVSLHHHCSPHTTGDVMTNSLLAMKDVYIRNQWATASNLDDYLNWKMNSSLSEPSGTYALPVMLVHCMVEHACKSWKVMMDQGLGS